ncbi:MAG: hypothetical protein GY776_16645 [Alteromonas sp.]|nr:hypothetical protein [Alteromonas sp.]
MKFSIPANGRMVILDGRIVKVAGGVYDTSDKSLQGKLSKCKGVSVIKNTKSPKE